LDVVAGALIWLLLPPPFVARQNPGIFEALVKAGIFQAMVMPRLRGAKPSC